MLPPSAVSETEVFPWHFMMLSIRHRTVIIISQQGNILPCFLLWLTEVYYFLRVKVNKEWVSIAADTMLIENDSHHKGWWRRCCDRSQNNSKSWWFIKHWDHTGSIKHLHHLLPSRCMLAVNYRLAFECDLMWVCLNARNLISILHDKRVVVTIVTLSRPKHYSTHYPVLPCLSGWR